MLWKGLLHQKQTTKGGFRSAPATVPLNQIYIIKEYDDVFKNVQTPSYTSLCGLDFTVRQIQKGKTYRESVMKQKMKLDQTFFESYSI